MPWKAHQPASKSLLYVDTMQLRCAVRAVTVPSRRHNDGRSRRSRACLLRTEASNHFDMSRTGLIDLRYPFVSYRMTVPLSRNIFQAWLRPASDACGGTAEQVEAQRTRCHRCVVKHEMPERKLRCTTQLAFALIATTNITDYGAASTANRSLAQHS